MVEHCDIFSILKMCIVQCMGNFMATGGESFLFISLSRSLFLPFSQAHVINFSYWSYVYSFSVRCCIFFFLHEKNFIFIQFIVSYACYITNKFFKWKKERYEMSTQRTGNTIIIINYTKSLSNDTKKECKCFFKAMLYKCTLLLAHQHSRAEHSIV